MMRSQDYNILNPFHDANPTTAHNLCVSGAPAHVKIISPRMRSRFKFLKLEFSHQSDRDGEHRVPGGAADARGVRAHARLRPTSDESVPVPQRPLSARADAARGALWRPRPPRRARLPSAVSIFCLFFNEVDDLRDAPGGCVAASRCGRPSSTWAKRRASWPPCADCGRARRSSWLASSSGSTWRRTASASSTPSGSWAPWTLTTCRWSRR